MGGEIGIRSQEGDGSVFWFTIVLKRPTPKQECSVRERTNLEGMAIAVVSEDQPLLDDLYGFAAGWTSGLEVYSPDQLDRLKEDLNSIDVVLLDERHANEATRQTLSALGKNVVLLSENVEGESAKLLRRAEIFRPDRRQVVRWNLGQVLLPLTPGTKKARNSEDQAAPVVVRDLLVAEDNAVNQKIVMAMLKKLGCKVTMACNGQKPWITWRKRPSTSCFSIGRCRSWTVSRRRRRSVVARRDRSKTVHRCCAYRKREHRVQAAVPRCGHE